MSGGSQNHWRSFSVPAYAQSFRVTFDNAYTYKQRDVLRSSLEDEEGPSFTIRHAQGGVSVIGKDEALMWADWKPGLLINANLPDSVPLVGDLVSSSSASVHDLLLTPEQILLQAAELKCSDPSVLSSKLSLGSGGSGFDTCIPSRLHITGRVSSFFYGCCLPSSSSHHLFETRPAQSLAVGVGGRYQPSKDGTFSPLRRLFESSTIDKKSIEKHVNASRISLVKKRTGSSSPRGARYCPCERSLFDDSALKDTYATTFYEWHQKAQKQDGADPEKDRREDRPEFYRDHSISAHGPLPIPKPIFNRCRSPQSTKKYNQFKPDSSSTRRGWLQRRAASVPCFRETLGETGDRLGRRRGGDLLRISLGVGIPLELRAAKEVVISVVGCSPLKFVAAVEIESILNDEISR